MTFICNACWAFIPCPDTCLPKTPSWTSARRTYPNANQGLDVCNNCFRGRGQLSGGQMSDHTWCLGIGLCVWEAVLHAQPRPSEMFVETWIVCVYVVLEYFGSRHLYARIVFIHFYTIRYDTRCYFNVRSKADISQLNLPHGTDN